MYFVCRGGKQTKRHLQFNTSRTKFNEHKVHNALNVGLQLAVAYSNQHLQFKLTMQIMDTKIKPDKTQITRMYAKIKISSKGRF